MNAQTRILHWLAAPGALMALLATEQPSPADVDFPKATAAPGVRTATTHPMKYYISLPKHWSANRTWPVLVAPSAHYGDKGATLAMFARERDARKAEFIIVQKRNYLL